MNYYTKIMAAALGATIFVGSNMHGATGIQDIREKFTNLSLAQKAAVIGMFGSAYLYNAKENKPKDNRVSHFSIEDLKKSDITKLASYISDTYIGAPTQKPIVSQYNGADGKLEQKVIAEFREGYGLLGKLEPVARALKSAKSGLEIIAIIAFLSEFTSH